MRVAPLSYQFFGSNYQAGMPDTAQLISIELENCKISSQEQGDHDGGKAAEGRPQGL
jgi:hypothetical protein